MANERDHPVASIAGLIARVCLAIVVMIAALAQNRIKQLWRPAGQLTRPQATLITFPREIVPAVLC